MMLPSVTGQSPTYEGGVGDLPFQPYPSPLPTPTPAARPQSARSLIQTKGQKGRDTYQEQVKLRLLYTVNSLTGMCVIVFLLPISARDPGIFVTRVQPDGPATHLLQPGDKILKANGHSFLNMEHTTAVCLLKSFHNP
ncbi:hypothetical protein JZ751_009392, partial [Albula glossodonta]